MKNYTLYLLNAVAILILLGCGATEETSSTIEELPMNQENADYSYLALGDSYTIGESVCDTCRFPIQLESAFEQLTNKSMHTDIIATTGWRTDNLIEAIEDQNPDNTYDFVTLLIGVNNQFQGIPFSMYENEFSQLLTTAINLAQGEKERVVVLSIPDYAFTPYGQTTSNPQQVSDELDEYNTYAKEVTENREVKFLNITDITRRGITEPNLVASDGLHPSEDAYAEFVDRLLLIVNTVVKD
ncbi:SGNH/GDSL hydrolase family protein [Leeuwenhoekiella marinoflava]|uniref:Lysophospholipase L1-like esterase n=2 Tax=Leeuwenhoekiella marinoflava TaxID=988 RepID=A0A4V1KSX7_9FLAO|nr:SGNH/GDSL hydrolase family protein [Leeuwenhoekiella marinoflava]RXG33278.1 lysophospholipase L1-like esterase [Leeuwenhoekiella marinoflava]SHE45369.1 Lysophospholipase L1 [Leeuwenhoekiella marinoflava DSM 3653]